MNELTYIMSVQLVSLPSFLREEVAYIQTTLVYAGVYSYADHSKEHDKRGRNMKELASSYTK